MKCFLLGILGFIVAGAIFAAMLYSQMHGFNARGVRPGGLERFMVQKWMRGGLPSGVTDIKDPLPVSPDNIADGRIFFALHCAFCHGNDGAHHTLVAAGVYPPVPNLRDESDMSDGEMFYIIKEGIRFSGMPGWGTPDDRNWKLVQFIRHLPQITPEELRLMEALNPNAQQNATPVNEQTTPDR